MLVNESLFIDNTTWMGNITMNYTRLGEEVWAASQRELTNFTLSTIGGDIVSMPLFTFAVLFFGFVILSEFAKDWYYSFMAGLMAGIIGFHLLETHPFSTFQNSLLITGFFGIMLYQLGAKVFYNLYGEYQKKKGGRIAWMMKKQRGY